MSDYLKEILRMADPDALKGAGAPEAKLTFVERCEILGLTKSGYKRNTVAAAYNVARPTVGYIISPSSRHYRNVRKEFNDLGLDAFLRKYVTPDVVEKANEAQKSIRAQATDDEDKAERRHETTLKGPNKNADGSAGLHTFQDIEDDIIRVTIEWLEEKGDRKTDVDDHEAFLGAGWYVVFPAATIRTIFGDPEATQDALWPGTPASGIEGPYPTSQMALRVFIQETQYKKVEL